ncbi:uncharacterized protein QC761_0021090 [Podospora bellae-mahoneyi]|uniref:Uncharacterized protein n=1 Tax=Podospora bellae-mahoneyi TaxID=2093777 RepID=A0ABR0G140_9PEZI|nr:hypothetical protein QC761_0021090 [Podospora bellae-mahoneyi]
MTLKVPATPPSHGLFFVDTQPTGTISQHVDIWRSIDELSRLDQGFSATDVFWAVMVVWGLVKV